MPTGVLIFIYTGIFFIFVSLWFAYKERWKIVWIILGTEILLFSIFAFGSEYLIGKGML